MEMSEVYERDRKKDIEILRPTSFCKDVRARRKGRIDDATFSAY